jgi:hypothetical protein
MFKLSLAGIQSDPYKAFLFDSMGRTRRWLIVFYSISLGFFIATYILTGIGLVAWVSVLFAIGILTGWYSVVDKPVVNTDPLQVIRPANSYGIVYIMRRDDGVLKVGRTVSLRHRLNSHVLDYERHFSMVASWVVPDATVYESIALKMTADFAYTESRRKELRQMTEAELSKFVLEFTEGVFNGFKKTA